jgi:aspartyl-tRNA synthetase
MLRTHTCGELNPKNISEKVTLCGWVQKSRDLGGMTFVDMRDRYGITQLVFNMQTNAKLCEKARKLGREFVISVSGIVEERSNKNLKIPTGEIEITVDKFDILSKSKLPPFTIEDNTDGGEELRMKYRYLDLRRNPLRKNLELRHRMTIETRNYLNSQKFIEIETPYLIKSTPEGARDFVVPSRMNEGEFYALPQSPQTFKQLLMIAGYDRYYQLVKCFRDEDLRADRQPEFTQIDCEMSFVTQDDILNTFEGLIKHLFKKVKNINVEDFPIISYDYAMKYYGTDKQPQIGAKGLVYVKYNEDGSFKSSVDKFFDQKALKTWSEAFNAEPGDLLLILSGESGHTGKALCELRLEMGNRLELRDKNKFCPLWIVDFPLLEWDDETNKYHAMHHPFTSPKAEDIQLLNSEPGKARANAYDLVRLRPFGSSFRWLRFYS